MKQVVLEGKEKGHSHLEEKSFDRVNSHVHTEQQGGKNWKSRLNKAVNWQLGKRTYSALVTQPAVGTVTSKF